MGPHVQGAGDLPGHLRIKIYAARGILGGRGVLNELLVHFGIIAKPITALVFNYNAIFIVFVIVYLPFAILPIYLSMERIPDNLGQASADLGGSPWHEIRHIVVPLSRTGIVVAAIFSFLMTFGDFVTSQLVGGVEGFMFGRVVFSQFALSFDETLVTLFLHGSESTLPIRLWAMVRLGFVPEVNALAALVLVGAALLTIAIAQLHRRNRVP